ncbi:MAG: PD-(D/E)XK nuclease family protein [Ruminococcus sp.]|nr:PD-(D/E)XK nuclease family protein [Ruminococcus sp.]
MLHLIYGGSGSGKTTEAVNILTELCKNGEDKLLMLVPDQSSFETETEFFEKLGARLGRNVLVFGFSRLCEYVFGVTGNTPQNVIDDGVRKIILSKALEEVQDGLDMFSGAKTRKSVLDIMLHSLKECKKDNITTDMLETAAKSIDSPTLQKKLNETTLVLDAYDALLSQTYIDPIDNLNRLKDILSDTRLFEGYTIVADSFSGFTGQQLEIIGVLMKQSKEFYATVNINIDEKNHEIFATTNRTRKAFRKLADDNGIEVDKIKILDKFVRSDSDEISFIENNFLRVLSSEYAEKTNNIETFMAADIYGEVSFVARKIKSLVVDEGYTYNQIAVIYRRENKYQGILDTAFEKLGIPYFMDNPQDIFTKPVVRFVSSVLDCVLNGFDRDALLTMLKTGLTSLSDTEISNLENYIFVWNIDGSDLKKEFKNNPSGFEIMHESDKSLLDEIERTRRYAVTPLIDFAEKCKNADVLTISKSLYSLFDSYGIDDSLNNLYDELERHGMLSQANEEVRVYNLLVEALDKLVATAGELNIPLKKYKEYLDYLLSDITFSEIPRYQDQVSVSEADRVRLNDVKAVFVIGAIDGEFPSVPETAGAFSEAERQMLRDNDIPLADRPEELVCHEKYLAYCAVTSASERLFVTTYKSDFEGNTFEPSVIFTEIKRLFPNAIHTESAEQDEIFQLYTKQQAFEYLARHYGDNAPEIAYLKSYFEGDEIYRSNVEKIDRVLKKTPFAVTNRGLTENLYGKNIKISASQLEKFSLCPFQYFCGYGLRAKERRVSEIDSIQFGNIVHYFLEKFLFNHKNDVLSKISDDEIRRDVDNILVEFADENFGGLDGKTSSFINLFNRTKINIFELIKQIIRQFEYSDFKPTDFELKIGDDGDIPAYKVDMEDGCSVSVRGFIDRVDTLEKNDDESYVRIVDYKTGNKEFKLYEILYGINMQMLIYLRALTENGSTYYGKKLIPAGVLYMPSSAKAIDGIKNDTEEKITKERDGTFCMNGLVLNDPDVLNHMDRLGSHIKVKSRVEDGKYSATVADSEQFRQIFKHIDDTIRSMGESLLSGNAAARPIKGVADGCAYCPYDSVCCREYDDDYNYCDKASPKEVYTKISGEEEDDG